MAGRGLGAHVVHLVHLVQLPAVAAVVVLLSAAVEMVVVQQWPHTLALL